MGRQPGQNECVGHRRRAGDLCGRPADRGRPQWGRRANSSGVLRRMCGRPQWGRAVIRWGPIVVWRSGTQLARPPRAPAPVPATQRPAPQVHARLAAEGQALGRGAARRGGRWTHSIHPESKAWRPAVYLSITVAVSSSRRGADGRRAPLPSKQATPDQARAVRCLAALRRAHATATAPSLAIVIRGAH